MTVAAPTEAPELLTVPELATLLRIDRKTVYSLIQAEEIPGVHRLGRVIRIHRPTVIAWLAGQNGDGSRSRSKP